MKEIFVRLDRCMGCRSCELACAIEHSDSKSLFASIAEKTAPIKRLYIEQAGGHKIPMVCRHCQDAPCVTVCRTGAMGRDAITGIVDRDVERCVGCWMCAMVCPYGVIGSQSNARVAVKCDLCKNLETPACVKACPTGTLVFSEPKQFMEMVRKDAATRIAEECKPMAEKIII